MATLNIVALVVSYAVVSMAYAAYDRSYYRCSRLTHAFGMIFPLAAIVHVNRSWTTPPGLLPVAVLGLGYGMFVFHVLYHFECAAGRPGSRR